MEKISSRLIAALAIVVFSTASTSVYAAPASADAGVGPANGQDTAQAPSGSSSFNAALIGSDASDGFAGGFEVGSSSSPIGLDEVPGSLYYAWTTDFTGVAPGVGSLDQSYINTAGRYDIFIYLENIGDEGWTGFDVNFNQCCWQFDDGTGTTAGPVATANGSEDVFGDSTQIISAYQQIIEFDRLILPGESLFIGTNVYYNMPFPFPPGPEILRMAPLTASAAVPVPAAVWLFGSALGLLGWIRRRNAA